MKNKNLSLIMHSRMESDRIILRPCSIDDAEDLYEFTSDEETTRFIYEPYKDVDQAKRVLANYYLEEPIGKYALVLKETNKMIGVVEFRVHEETKGGELGYTLSRHYWGNGYMTEAGKLILELAFNVLGVERVFAATDIRNTASAKLMSRLGMKHEGTLRRNHMIKGELTDSFHYSILKEEYESES
ncbi:ribosomal-protein-alanine N-acetyltransferase [Paenibacillus sp. DS2015]|uniref:GNAT family N-acetyltransferase n=1 Tax=Paenibacillus sp. DS2015 TaxID=3373917 RepID=UPI003D20450C